MNPYSEPQTIRSVNRRDLLKWMSFGAGAAATGGGMFMMGRRTGDAHSPLPTGPGTIATRSTEPPGTDAPTSDPAPDSTEAPTDPPATEPPATDPGPAAPVRTLVVIEMSGGNDGMSMLVPFANARYYEMRPTTAIAADTVIRINDQVGLHPALGRLSKRPLAAVQGVGSHNSDGSHFEMMRRWWAGDPDGTGAYDAGVLGRFADAIGDPAAPAVAVAIGTGQHPALVSRTVGTLTMSGPDQAGYLVGADPSDTVRTAFQKGLLGMAQGGGDGAIGFARNVALQSIDFAGRLIALEGLDANGDGQPDSGVAYPGSTLGQGLLLASRLIHANTGVRIVHVPMGEDFDTHENHNERYNANMAVLDEALDAFLTDITNRGSSDNVVVMTTSEFGRRATENSSAGLDHGAASHMLVFGAVNPGLYGEYPSLDDLEHDSLRPGIALDEYYATIAEGWFGIPAGDVFNGAKPLAGLF